MNVSQALEGSVSTVRSLMARRLSCRKTSRLLLSIGCFCLVATTVGQAGEQVLWGNFAGESDWMSGSSWKDGAVPGTEDIAEFPSQVPKTGAQPVLNSDTEVNAPRQPVASATR